VNWRQAIGSCPLPINQCAALLPERTKGSAGRSMPPRTTDSQTSGILLSRARTTSTAIYFSHCHFT